MNLKIYLYKIIITCETVKNVHLHEMRFQKYMLIIMTTCEHHFRKILIYSSSLLAGFFFYRKVVKFIL